MSQAHIQLNSSPLIFTKFLTAKAVFDEGGQQIKKIMSFYMQGTMIQSTINSQCGQLQSASSHAIKSKFQAWFSSTFIVVSPSVHFQSVMSVWLSGYEMDKINPGVHECVYEREGERAHYTAAEMIYSAASGMIRNS